LIREELHPKYNENRAFLPQNGYDDGKVAFYLSHLCGKFVTPRINGIFQRINELRVFAPLADAKAPLD